MSLDLLCARAAELSWRELGSELSTPAPALAWLLDATRWWPTWRPVVEAHQFPVSEDSPLNPWAPHGRQPQPWLRLSLLASGASGRRGSSWAQ